MKLQRILELARRGAMEGVISDQHKQELAEVEELEALLLQLDRGCITIKDEETTDDFDNLVEITL